MASNTVVEQRPQAITSSPQQQSSLYSSSINVNNGPALNNVYPSAPLQSTSATNTPTSSQSNSGNNHTITALDGHNEPAVEARRLKGKCKVNNKIFKFSLDSGCDLTTISAKVAEEAGVEYMDEHKYMPKLADGL